ncbi:metallophosphoesterase family protein [Deltaproteobacteria bacterium OttesenSCG-928-K17]|nr:metallophosphoesterase family protein [Deltaproteobacteria bacterium OttesenSCG-928-K17]
MKKSAAALTLAVLFTVVFSAIYNKPIRFQPKIMAYTRSVYTPYPSTSIPDQIILSPGEDSARSIRLSWRASKNTGEVHFWEQGQRSDRFLTAQADLTVLESPELRADSVNYRFSAVLDNLKPATTYQYKVGDHETGQWSGIHNFTTAPEAPAKFSFIYFGDTQVSPVEFGRLLEEVDVRYPETSLYLIAGDLVEDGEWRYMWDSFALNTSGVFSRKALAPALGNHDYKQLNGNGLKYFSNYFNTPANGPSDFPKGLNYSFSCANVRFIILDSNYDIAAQTDWLERQLSEESEAAFKVVMFHSPPYHPKENRASQAIQKHWVPLFDEYRVDLVLNGHDHSYLRTQKMRNNRPIADGVGGAIYVTSTATEKYYKFIPLNEAEIQFGNTLTYQLISVSKDEQGAPYLTFKAFDREHNLKDEFTITAPFATDASFAINPTYK